jgi:hypothetical protein
MENVFSFPRETNTYLVSAQTSLGKTSPIVPTVYVFPKGATIWLVNVSFPKEWLYTLIGNAYSGNTSFQRAYLGISRNKTYDMGNYVHSLRKDGSLF